MLTILTDGGIVTEVLPVQDEEGNPGYAVHGDLNEGFYPAEFVEVIGEDDDSE